MSAQVESNGASESNNNCVKDVRLLLLPENSTDSDGNPASVAFSAESHKKFIDDLTRTIDVGHVRRKRLWRVPWFILLMSFVQVRFYAVAPLVRLSIILCFPFLSARQRGV